MVGHFTDCQNVFNFLDLSVRSILVYLFKFNESWNKRGYWMGLSYLKRVVLFINSHTNSYTERWRHSRWPLWEAHYSLFTFFLSSIMFSISLQNVRARKDLSGPLLLLLLHSHFINKETSQKEFEFPKDKPLLQTGLQLKYKL